MVLQKGISPSDQEALEEVKVNLVELLADVERLSAADSSRDEFSNISDELKEKYADSEFDFEVDEILDEVILQVQKSLDKKESDWKTLNLSLGDKSRNSVHCWKEKTKFLPGYLSKETKDQVKKIDAEADEIIKDGKIEDVLFYFKKLTEEEKRECINKLHEIV